jgi:hypothetical protein
LEAGSVPFGPNFRNLTFGEPSSGFTPGPRSASLEVMIFVMWHYVYKNSNYNYALVINYASFKLNIKTPFEVQLYVLYLTFYLQKFELQYIAIDDTLPIP